MILGNVCPSGYPVQSLDTICGTQQFGSPGEVNIGGPNWPTASSSLKESAEACATKCTESTECTHYMWFSDKGCRLQSSCSTQVPGYGPNTSFICRKGYFYLYHMSVILKSR